MEDYLWIILILVGIVDLCISIRFIKDSKFAEDYFKSSGKAWLWKKILGEEKAMKVTKKVFAPIGIVLGILLVIAGLVLLVLSRIL